MVANQYSAAEQSICYMDFGVVKNTATSETIRTSIGNTGRYPILWVWSKNLSLDPTSPYNIENDGVCCDQQPLRTGLTSVSQRSS